MRPISLLVILTVLASGGVSVQAATPSARESIRGSLCHSSEQPLFICPLKGRVISVCASKPYTADSGYVQYRSSRGGRMELVYPRSRTAARGHFRYSWQERANGSEQRLRFRIGDYDYLVYDSNEPGGYIDAEGHRDNSGHAGVLVRKHGIVVSRVQCQYSDGRSILDHSMAEPLPKEPFDPAVR